MKRFFPLLLLLLLALTASGCRQDAVPDFSEPTNPIPVETAAPTETASAPFSFSELQHQEFLFASGAGGWGTVLYIQPDGSFTGNYHDSEAETGPGYPNGAVAYCDFSGQFGQPVPVDAYTWSLPLEQLEYLTSPGTEEIKDGILYRYVAAHGVTGAEFMLLYLPGAPVADLPEEFTQWFGYDLQDTAQLPFYALYNAENWYCFYGTDLTAFARQLLEEAEASDAKLQTQLQEAVTQADMNILSEHRYWVWDGALNQFWHTLKKLPEDQMQALTNEELAWIQEKEQAVAQAGAEVEGGSLYPTVTNSMAATMTRDRVYELLEYLP